MADLRHGLTEEQKVMAWAIEQAILLHGENGVTTEIMFSEARKIYRFVMDAHKVTS